MKNTSKILFLLFTFTLIFQTKTANALTVQKSEELRACYQSALNEAISEDSNEYQGDSFTLENVQNPDAFFADCESVDYKIIKELYVDFYNIDKLMVSTDHYLDYDLYKQHVRSTISNLKIDFTPEDLNKVEQWAPFSKAIQSVYDEYSNRDKPLQKSNEYIHEIYSLQFDKLDDQTLGKYVLNYLSNITETKCNTDCEIVFDFMRNSLSVRPEAMRSFLELSDQSNEFIHDNIELGYRYAELKRQARKKSNTKKTTDPKKYKTASQGLNINNDSNSKAICEQIKHIPVAQNCRSAQFILNKLSTVDLVADEIWKDTDQCQNKIILKTIHSEQQKSKNNKMNTNLNLIIQVFNETTGYVFNETWFIKNLQDLKNQCSAL